MPSFVYEGVDKKGKALRGTLWAQSKQKAILELRNGGLTVKSLEEKQKSILDLEIRLGSRISKKEFVVFCRQFATLIRSGIQIDQALKLLANQTKSRMMKKVLSEVLDHLRSGLQLSDALAKHPKDFPPMFINMVASGEIGGNLDDILDHMATHYEKDSKSMAKVRSALMYPAIVLVVAACVVVFLLRTIVPTFEELFAEQGAELPFITTFVVSVSRALETYWYGFLVLSVLPILIVRAVLATKTGRYWFDYGKYCIPLFGPLLKKSTLARMARTMAALFYGGIPVIQILTVSEKVVQNEAAARVLSRTREKMMQGKQMSEPFKESGFFPDLFNQVIQVGEETGQIDIMLAKIADYYESDVERAIEQIKTLIEPALMMMLTAVVGVIVAAIITPMFSLYEQIIK
jgi:type IV pilus assembly protein PilC